MIKNASRTTLCGLRLAALAIFFSSTSAYAEEDESKKAHEIANERGEALAGGDLSAPDWSVSTGYEDIAATAQISSENEILKAKLALNYAFGGEPTFGKTSANVPFKTTQVWNASIKADVPLNSSSPDSMVDFKSFGIDGKVSIGINYMSLSYVEPIFEDPFLEELAQECISIEKSKWINQPNGMHLDDKKAHAKRFADDYSLKLNDPNQLEQWDAVLESLSGSMPDNPFSQVAMNGCHPSKLAYNNARAIIGYFEDGHRNNSVFRKYKDSLPSDSVTFAGIEGSAGLNRFKLVENSPFGSRDVDRVGFDVNAHYGKLFNRGNTALRLGAGYTRVYEAKDEVTFCQDLMASMSEECITGQNGIPNMKNTGYVEFGLRHVLRRSGNRKPKLAIAPSVTYILEDKDFQFRLPLYFQRSDDGGLDVGVQAIYNGADDQVGIGAFVGIPFNLTGK